MLMVFQQMTKCLYMTEILNNLKEVIHMKITREMLTKFKKKEEGSESKKEQSTEKEESPSKYKAMAKKYYAKGKK